jgi:hypothetical protein
VDRALDTVSPRSRQEALCAADVHIVIVAVGMPGGPERGSDMVDARATRYGSVHVFTPCQVTLDELDAGFGEAFHASDGAHKGSHRVPRLA